MAPMATRRALVGVRRASSTRSQPPRASTESMAYMRVSVPYRMANGDSADRPHRVPPHPAPAEPAAGHPDQGQERHPPEPAEQGRTATVPSPNSSIQPCRST